MMEEASKLFNRFANLMDQNYRGVQIGCYSVACVGLTIALRKVRPFSKFKNPRSIPNHFIAEKRELDGIVRRIEPDGGLLMVEHKPLVNIPIISSGQLPVKISGVNISSLGLSWLQAIVSGSDIKFVPLRKDNKYVECKVLLVQDVGSKKPKIINVGENLVKIGFAQTDPLDKPLPEDPDVIGYYRRLQAAEDYAIRKKLGLKYYVKPTKKALAKLYDELNDLSKKLFVTSKKLIKEVPRISAA